MLLISGGLLWGDAGMDKNLSVVKTDIHNQVFKHLQLCYECEFAPITKMQMEPDGTYDQKELEAEWAHKYDIYLLYNGDIPAGFCVVNCQSMIDGDTSTHDIAEFYITPIYRHSGYGTWFAHYIFKLYPGRWEVRQLPELGKTVRNFWISAIKSIDHKNFTEITDHATWHGFIQRFDIL